MDTARVKPTGPIWGHRDKAGHVCDQAYWSVDTSLLTLFGTWALLASCRPEFSYSQGDMDDVVNKPVATEIKMGTRLAPTLGELLE